METKLNQLSSHIDNSSAVNTHNLNSKLDDFRSDLVVMFMQVVGNMTEALAEEYQHVPTITTTAALQPTSELNLTLKYHIPTQLKSPQNPGEQLGRLFSYCSLSTTSYVSLTCYYCKLCNSFGVSVSYINVHKNSPYQIAGPVVHVGYSINVCGDIHSEVHFSQYQSLFRSHLSPDMLIKLRHEPGDIYMYKTGRFRTQLG